MKPLKSSRNLEMKLINNLGKVLRHLDQIEVVDT